LVAHQVKDLHAFIKFTPGLISSSWHRSLDNTRVTNYAQWESVEAFKAAVADPAFQKHSAEAEALSISHDSHFYEVITTSDDET
jgi:quinol monooxygenase YgiN